MLEKFDSLIGKLIQARQRGLLVNGQENGGIDSLDTAYQIQEKVLEGLGSESMFWKVGSTSIEAQKKLGTDEPGSCRVPEKYCFFDGDKIVESVTPKKGRCVIFDGLIPHGAGIPSKGPRCIINYNLHLAEPNGT